MGTRAIIQVVGSADLINKSKSYGQSVRLYRHNDGDPKWTLAGIASAIVAIEEKAKEKGKSLIAPEPMAVAIEFGSMQSTYLSARIEEVFDNARPKLDDLSNQPDLEWLYVVDVIKKNVNVFTVKERGGYSGAPRTHLEASYFTSVRKVYESQLKPEYVDVYVQGWETASAAIRNAGWTLNQAVDPYLAVIQRSASRRASLQKAGDDAATALDGYSAVYCM